MSFYKSTGASFKEVQDGDLLCTSPTEDQSHYATAEIFEFIKPEIFRENRNQIFFIRSSRFLGDKYRGRNIYFTIKPDCNCRNCLFRYSSQVLSCALRLKEGREQDYTRSFNEQYPCIIENVHFEEYKM